MIAARIHSYQNPLVIEEVSKPAILQGDQVLLKVDATGLSHGDLHLINGDWKEAILINLPLTPGSEVAGSIEELGDTVPKEFLKIGDKVAVYGGWGCGMCTYCKGGDEQMCSFAKWPGIAKDGGFSQYLLVDSYRFLVKIDPYVVGNKKDSSGYKTLNMEEIAPLTNAGLTPYRAIKKIKNLLGPKKCIGIFGIGGLGYYAVQYAKILGQSSDVIALDIKDRKLELAQTVGADYTINVSKDFQKIKEEVLKITKGDGVDVIIDCVGTEDTIYNSARFLNKSGTIVIVGLFGEQIKIPLVQSVINEYKIYGSLWGNYNELKEVIDLELNGKIKHSINKFSLKDINRAIDLLKHGEIDGRSVIVP